MTNSRALNSAYQLLDKHVAATTEATYTFTPTIALDPDLYSKIMVIITGKSTAALVLGIQLNTITTGTYFTSGCFTNMSAIAHYAVSAADFGHLLTATIIDGAIHFQGQADIFITDIGTGGDLVIQSKFSSATEHEDAVCYNSGSLTNISAITILTSTSTWIAGTKIMIYGLRN